MAADLEFVTTEDMVEELLRRSDSAAILLRQAMTESGGQAVLRFAGSPFDALGLMQFASSKLLGNLHASARRVEFGADVDESELGEPGLGEGDCE